MWIQWKNPCIGHTQRTSILDETGKNAIFHDILLFFILPLSITCKTHLRCTYHKIMSLFIASILSGLYAIFVVGRLDLSSSQQNKVWKERQRIAQLHGKELIKVEIALGRNHLKQKKKTNIGLAGYRWWENRQADTMTNVQTSLRTSRHKK